LFNPLEQSREYRTSYSNTTNSAAQRSTHQILYGETENETETETETQR